ncbi:hypothetical protein O181_106116 [Austropuccinia psidii MF-1]|uniref:Uncharacterized protein n=1 Tax=Austropuccinia psidii MF-1 TaxID=1389203 RepID=A0A9Q3JQD1_9BASI|nr:hypothetical protein [Austropuccinia psidii MF-1]
MHLHGPPDVTTTLLPISTLTTPYAPTETSKYTSNTALNPPYASSHSPLTMLMLHTYAPAACSRTPAAPSRYASDVALNPPYAFSHPPNPLCCLPSLFSCSALKMRLQCLLPISALTTPYASAPLLLTILMLPRLPQDMPPTPPSTLVTPNPLHHLPSLRFHIRSIGCGGLLAYMINTITEIC